MEGSIESKRAPRRGTGVAAAFLIAFIALFLVPASASAAVIIPTTFQDGYSTNGDCTLREAVVSANFDVAVDACQAGGGTDSIRLSNGTYQLTIPPSGTEFDQFSGSLVIFDPGETTTLVGFVGGTTINAAGIDRAIATGSDLSLIWINVVNGDAAAAAGETGRGGGIIGVGSPEPSIIALFSTIAANTATTLGGGIHSNGPVTLSGSTVSGNTVTAADDPGGGGGGVSAEGALVVNRSTVAFNSAAGAEANGGGFIYGDEMTLAGSLLSDNTAEVAGPDCYTAGAGVGTADHNFISDDSGCSLTPAGSDQIGGDPMLAPLGNNGGITLTHALLPGSDALDIGPAGAADCSIQLEQRGAPRGGPAGACDAGSYELVYCGFAPVNSIGSIADDEISGPPAPLNVIAQGGDDTVTGTGGNDSICGEGGVDVLDGRAGSDLLIGGAGIDRVTYANRAEPISVTLDSVANDGAAGEGDLVSVESVIGGTGNDTLSGNGQANGLIGGKGDDVLGGGGGSDSLLGQDGDDSIGGGDDADYLDGGKGDDFISGGSGGDELLGFDDNDKLNGDDGNDTLDGGDGRDKLKGGDGRDILLGGGGKDKLVGGDGNDVLKPGGGKDKVKCGGGKDKVVAGKSDKVAKDCEKVKRKGR